MSASIFYMWFYTEFWAIVSFLTRGNVFSSRWFCQYACALILKYFQSIRFMRRNVIESPSYRVIKLSSSIALCMLELYRWTIDDRPKCRGVRGVSIATHEPCSLLPARIYILCLLWYIPTSPFVLCYKCIQLLVSSDISSWAMGYHAPWIDPRTGWLSMHVPSPPVFSPSVAGGSTGLFGLDGMIPLPLTWSWWATWFAVTWYGGFGEVGSLESLLIVFQAFRLLWVMFVDVMTSSHIFLFSSVILSSSRFYCRRGSLSVVACMLQRGSLIRQLAPAHNHLYILLVYVFWILHAHSLQNGCSWMGWAQRLQCGYRVLLSSHSNPPF